MLCIVLCKNKLIWFLKFDLFPDVADVYTTSMILN